MVILHYNAMNDGKNCFDQPGKNDVRTYESIRKIVTIKRSDCATVCLLDYQYFKEKYIVDIAMVSSSRFIWITNSGDHRRV